ncbi:MAG: DpnD/PcfM family protein, partial [Clostridium celatum]|nr:DpnD/PcfM family protein [Clostridium celatum]
DNMNKYKFNIEEILNKEVTVEAKSFEEAMKIINKLYRNEEIVLDYDDFVGYTINYIDEEK